MTYIFWDLYVYSFTASSAGPSGLSLSALPGVSTKLLTETTIVQKPAEEEVEVEEPVENDENRNLDVVRLLSLSLSLFALPFEKKEFVSCPTRVRLAQVQCESKFLND